MDNPRQNNEVQDFASSLLVGVANHNSKAVSVDFPVGEGFIGLRVGHFSDGRLSHIDVLIPIDQFDKCIDNYVKEWAKQHKFPLLVSQYLPQRQKLRRFVVDFDLRTSARPSTENISELMTVVHGAVQKYRPTLANEMLISSNSVVRCDPLGSADRALKALKLISESEMKECNGNQQAAPVHDCLTQLLAMSNNTADKVYACTLRVFWDFSVTAEQALQLRESIVYALDLKKGDLLSLVPSISWGGVVDESNLTDGCVPFLGCHQISRCVLCSSMNSIKPCCPGCHGAEVVAEVRPFRHWGVVKSVDEKTLVIEKCIDRPSSALVTRCSLFDRAAEASAFPPGQFVIPLGEPRCIPKVLLKTVHVTYTDNLKEHVAFREFPKDVFSCPLSNLRFVRFGDSRWGCVETFIRSIPSYAKVQIKWMATTTLCKYYLIALHGYGSSYCQHVKKDHSNSTVYFRIDKATKQMAQYCHDCRIPDGCFPRRLEHLRAVALFSSKSDVNDDLERWMLPKPVAVQPCAALSPLVLGRDGAATNRDDNFDVTPFQKCQLLPAPFIPAPAGPPPSHFSATERESWDRDFKKLLDMKKQLHELNQSKIAASNLPILKVCSFSFCVSLLFSSPVLRSNFNFICYTLWNATLRCVARKVSSQTLPGCGGNALAVVFVHLFLVVFNSILLCSSS